MKNILIFTAGIVTGAVLMIFISLVFASNFSHNDMNLFENEGECISENSFEVFQVLDSGDALANEIEEKIFNIITHRFSRFIFTRKRKILL